MDTTFWSRFCALLVLLWAVACQRTEPTGTFIGRGVVKDILPKDRQVIIAHDAIPGFMEAMTMGFEVKEERLLEGIARGQEVTFTVEKTQDSLYLTALTREGEPSAALLQTKPDELEEEQEVSFPEPLPAPDFTLIDQDENPVQLSSLRGKVVLLDFIYTSCPGPCPLLSRKFSQFQKTLGERVGKEIVLLSITVDPQHDTPAVLKEYARRYQADTTGWKFLTGSTQAIVSVTYLYGADFYGEPGKEINHLVATYVIDQAGNMVKVLKGPNHPAEELVQVVHELLPPASSVSPRQ
ncbi:MAG TPA: SCO family protein [Candidatus Binatia bacterium]|jgi:protein SCO1/2|nr:SCO family protein [Candidatus Binatia bacterium]